MRFESASSARRPGRQSFRRSERGYLVSNSLELLQEVVDSLCKEGFNVLVFGGWAEELLDLAEPRAHSDIDLLVLDADIEMLDKYVSLRGEILEKHFSHKRAFEAQHVLVEMFLVDSGRQPTTTTFWDHFRWEWPTDMRPVRVKGLAVASVDAVRSFRDRYGEIQRARPDPDEPSPELVVDSTL